MKNENASLRTNVSLLLLSYNRFDAFSDDQWSQDQDPGRYGSLEDVHNEIHDKLGQGGHMGSLGASAFVSKKSGKTTGEGVADNLRIGSRLLATSLVSHRIY
jgi:hypothetical protein